MNLYEISAEYRKALAELSEVEGLTNEIIEDSLSAIKGEVIEKGRNVAAYFLNLDAEASALKEAEKKMNARRKVIENRVNGLKDYLKNHMAACKISKINCPEFAVTLINPRKIVVIDDVDAIPFTFVKVEQVVSIVKKKIKEALDDGKPVKGAHLEYGDYGLKIK